MSLGQIIFFTILFSFPVTGLFWWWWADRRLARARSPRVRWALAAFMLFQLGAFAWLLLTRFRDMDVRTPIAVLTPMYIWYMVLLPAAMVASVMPWAVFKLTRAVRRLIARARSTAGDAQIPAGPDLQRRALLARSVTLAPPVLTLAATGVAIPRLDDFRTRRFSVPVVNLPAELKGLKIAHVTDVHVGRFSGDTLLGRIVERVNSLEADLCLLTGDLIDFSLRDLPAGLDMVRAFRTRYGSFMCEGNHDLFDGHLAFERAVRDSGVPLLLNEEHTLNIRGQRLQILGIRWGDPAARRASLHLEHTRTTLKLRDPGAVNILLAHHPEAFDVAAEQGVALTLAGHTHGGQLMLSPDLGPGPLMYKYWSGLYSQGASHCVVGNGTGNWFPLRINAPAEIALITLTRA